jgi:hypothetical protein
LLWGGLGLFVILVGRPGGGGGGGRPAHGPVAGARII